MSDDDLLDKFGLPKELRVFETIAKEGQKIEVALEKRRFGKSYTVVKGINEHEINIKDVAKKLKSKFACGGTSKDGIIELQGNHTKDIKAELIKLGFAPESVEVK